MRHCVGITYDCFGKKKFKHQLVIHLCKKTKTKTLIEALA